MWGYVVALTFLGYLLPHALVALLPTQNLKKKARHSTDCCVLSRAHTVPDARRVQYNASWALVTGASSGAFLLRGCAAHTARR